MTAYGPDLAFIHDAGYSDFSRRSAAWLLRALPGNGLTVDVGCGSGRLARAFTDAGRAVLGVDPSSDFLALARRNAPAARFVRGSLGRIRLPEAVAITAIGEVLGYAPSLNGFFARAFHALEPGGALAFDVITGPYPPRRGFTEGTGWLCLFDNEQRGERVVRRITALRALPGGRCRRSDELHRVRIFDPAQLLRDLRATGFIRVRKLRGYGEERFAPWVTGFLAFKPGPRPRAAPRG